MFWGSLSQVSTVYRVYRFQTKIGLFHFDPSITHVEHVFDKYVQCTMYLTYFDIYYVFVGHKLSKAMHHSASQWTWNYLDQRFVPFVSIQPHCWKGCQEHQTYLKSVKMMVSCTSLRSDDMSLNPTPCDTVMEAFQVLSAKRQHWKEHGGSLESKKLLSDESFI